MSAFEEFGVCRDILESLLTGVCVIDMQKKIVFWSDGAEAITGHLRHEVIGRSCIAEPLLHCDHPGCEFCGEQCPLAKAMRTSRPVETIGFLHHKSGYEIPVSIRALAVHNQHGSIIGAVETFDKPETEDLKRGDTAQAGCADETTGVASRAQVNVYLRGALASFAQQQIAFGVLRVRLLGLEHFRAAFGSDAASSLLRVVARSLGAELQRTDFVGRWADDEFLVLVNSPDAHALAAVREHLRGMLANDSIEWWGERRSLPACIGEALVQPGDTVESLLDRNQKSLDADSAWRTRFPAGAGNQSSGS